MAIAIAAMPIAIDLMNLRENIEGLRDGGLIVGPTMQREGEKNV